MEAVAQIGVKRVSVPWHRRRRLRVDRIGLPIVDIAAGKARGRPLRAERVARRVAGAAMRQALDQIGAAIPFGTLRRVRPVGAGAQEQQLPSGDDHAMVEREGQLVLPCCCANRLARHQEGIERAVVVIADIGEMVVGKGRIEMPALAIDAGAHGAPKGRFRPAADAGLRIGRDVGREHRAERRRHRQAAGEILAAAHGVAGIAIAERRKLAAALDQSGIEALFCRRIDRGHRRPPGDRKAAAAPPTSSTATTPPMIPDFFIRASRF